MHDGDGGSDKCDYCFGILSRSYNQESNAVQGAGLSLVQPGGQRYYTIHITLAQDLEKQQESRPANL